jgi:ketosteroid isomerase-like protein
MTAIPMPLATEAADEAARFVRAFAKFWNAPTPERFRALMHPDVRLIQPLAPPAQGIEAAVAWFTGTQALLPDIRIAVRSWSGTPEALFIEWTATATFGGRPVSWNAVDRFRLEGGLVRERVAYFDALPLVGTILARPAGWPHALRTWLAARRAV